MPAEKLDNERILQLLRKADSKWFTNHRGQFNYNEHLDFTADYISKHYRAPAHTINRKSSGGGKDTIQQLPLPLSRPRAASARKTKEGKK